MKLSSAEENYIKNIYHLQHTQPEATATLLAAAVSTRAASVTDMLKKLQAKKIINYKPYKSFTLTEPGNRLALEVIRKHRLWEFFLVSKLGFNWDKVHAIAEELEHISSKELVNRLDEFLGHPGFDPHGDPIPDSRGKMRNLEQVSLTDLPLKKPAVVSSIRDQRPEMLEMLQHYHIGIGTKLRLLQRFEFDGSVEIKLDKLGPTVLSPQLAKNIYCII